MGRQVRDSKQMSLEMVLEDYLGNLYKDSGWPISWELEHFPYTNGPWGTTRTLASSNQEWSRHCTWRPSSDQHKYWNRALSSLDNRHSRGSGRWGRWFKATQLGWKSWDISLALNNPIPTWEPQVTPRGGRDALVAPPKYLLYIPGNCPSHSWLFILWTPGLRIIETHSAFGIGWNEGIPNTPWGWNLCPWLKIAVLRRCSHRLMV